MKVYFVRHGVSIDHEEKKSQSSKSELGKTGKEQASLVARSLLNLTFNRVLASKWTRAAQTAEIIAKKVGKEVELVEGIHEREKDASLEGIKHKDEVFEKFWSEFKKHGHKMDWKYGEGGESLKELVDRSQKFKLHLIKHHIDEDVLVVSHSLFIRAFVISTLLGNDLHEKSFVKLFNSISTDNTGITLMEYFPEREHWELRFLNDHSHLRIITNTHQMRLQPEYFDKIKSGIKTIEVRLFDEKRSSIQVGDTIVFTREPDKRQKLDTEVIDLIRYDTFKELVSAFDPSTFGSSSREELLESIYKFYSNEDEKKYGVLGIKIKLL